MSGQRKGKRRGSKDLRSYRQKISLEGVVIAGNPRHTHVVYGYRFPSHPGRMKIGYSSRGIERVVEQSTAFPEKPKLIFMIHDPDAKRLEKAFHLALADRQSDVMGTEWFDVSWRDVLSVSPHLRRATGKGGRRQLRWVMTFIAVFLAALAYPALAAACAGWVENVPFSAIAASVRAYGQMLLDLDVSQAWEMAKRMMSYAWDVQGSLYTRWLPLGLILVPPVLPWVLWRQRQAR